MLGTGRVNLNLKTAKTCFQKFDRPNAYNFGQNSIDKFSKLSKVGFSVKCLRGGFL